MANFLRTTIASGLALLACSSCLSLERNPEEKILFQPDEWTVASNDRLDSLRGGFDMGAGLKMSFGMVRTVSINGDVVNSSSFNFPDITQITPEQARIANTVMSESGLVQIGLNNVLTPSVKSQLAAGTFIQNSLNDQKIQTLTVFNAGVNSLGLLKAINTQSTLRDAILASIGIK